MADLYPHKAEFEPLYLPGETVHLVKADGELDVEIKAIDAMPRYQANFGAVTAATWSLNNTDTNLRLNKMELAQFRIIVIDDIQLYLSNPASTQHWRSSLTRFFLPQFPDDDNFLQHFIFGASQFYIWEDTNDPSFDIYPQRTLASSRVWFMGYKFSCRGISTRGVRTLYVNSWPSGSAK